MAFAQRRRHRAIHQPQPPPPTPSPPSPLHPSTCIALPRNHTHRPIYSPPPLFIPQKIKIKVTTIPHPSFPNRTRRHNRDIYDKNMTENVIIVPFVGARWQHGGGGGWHGHAHRRHAADVMPAAAAQPASCRCRRRRAYLIAK